MKEEKLVQKFAVLPLLKSRKNDELVAGMYAMYLELGSYIKVAAAYRRSRKTVLEMFRRRGYNLQARKYNESKVINGVKYSKQKSGKWYATTGDRKLLT